MEIAIGLTIIGVCIVGALWRMQIVAERKSIGGSVTTDEDHLDSPTIR
jgi:hypothetical protein